MNEDNNFLIVFPNTYKYTSSIEKAIRMLTAPGTKAYLLKKGARGSVSLVPVTVQKFSRQSEVTELLVDGEVLA